VTISIYEASVGLFVPYLRNLSVLLDKGVAYAEARKFNPAVLLGMRLAPNMYDLAQQVGEACRHATVAPAVLAQRDPVVLPVLEHDMAGLQARIATSIDVHREPAARRDRCRGRADRLLQAEERHRAAVHGTDAAADVQRPAILLSRHDRLRPVAARRRRTREEGLSRKEVGTGSLSSPTGRTIADRVLVAA
jgi:hypothetical protein